MNNSAISINVKISMCFINLEGFGGVISKRGIARSYGKSKLAP